MNRIDKAAVRRSFNRAARRYDENARLQHAVANRLLAQFTPLAAACIERRHPQILDAGAGSGFSAAALACAFPNARVVNLDFAQEMLKIARRKSRGSGFVCGDLETLPFADAAFDLACSSSALQWSDDISLALREFRRVLKQGSALLLAIYTTGTLRELQDSWPGTDRHTLEFPTPERLCRMIEAAGMTIASCRTQNEAVIYDDVDALLKILKCTGVRNLRRDRCAGLTTPARLENMKARYRARYAAMQGIPASYAVTFVCAARRRKAAG